MNIEEKYQIKYIDNKRYYEIDLNESLPLLENTAPYEFKYRDIEIKTAVWGKFTLAILEAIDKINPKTKAELLTLQYDWTKTKVFRENKQVNHLKFKDLYLNVNHTAVHHMMNIQGLLKFYEIPLDECEILIRKHHIAESEEVIDYIKNKTIEEFSFMLKIKGYNEQTIRVIINNFNILNLYLERINSSYNEFLAFDDYVVFTNYRIKVLEAINQDIYLKAKNAHILEKCLNLLAEFYNNRKFYQKLMSNPIDNQDLNSLRRLLVNLLVENDDSLDLDSCYKIAIKDNDFDLKEYGIKSRKDFSNLIKAYFSKVFTLNNSQIIRV